jgi:hypothetical protein
MDNSGSEDLWLLATGAVLNGGRCCKNSNYREQLSFQSLDAASPNRRKTADLPISEMVQSWSTKEDACTD